jgi:hypothetical protein
VNQWDEEHENGVAVFTNWRVFRRQRIHRVRIGGVASGGLVVSLCGVMIRVVGNPIQTGTRSQLCNRCEALAELHPVEPQWWDAMTQRVCGLMLDDLRSTALAVGQAAAGARDPATTLHRADLELRQLCRRIGLPEPLPPSLHHRSTAA